MRSRFWLGILLLGAVAGLAWGRPGVVRTTDGRTIEGDITEQGEGVEIRTKAAAVVLPRREVASIVYAATTEELYKKRLAELPPNANAAAHIGLARWLYENRALDLARVELEKALALDPKNADAALLLQTVNRTAEFERQKPPSPQARPVATTRPATTQPVAGDVQGRPVLDADQINVIKQFELKDTDTRLRVRFDRDVRRRFIGDATGRDSAARDFNALPDVAKAIRILQEGTPEMRRDVRILNDPQSLLEYKTRIQPIVLNGCATAACHGGPEVRKFVLYTPAQNDAVSYTNFYILTQYSINRGIANVKAIDRVAPNRSLLVQCGLPPAAAEFPHPDVPGFTPLFKGERDPRLVQIVTWIGQSLKSVEPEYGIQFAVPGEPATRPTRSPEEPLPFEPDPRTQPPEDQRQQRPPVRRPGAQPTERPQDANDRVRDARERMRPINPGSIPIPPTPF